MRKILSKTINANRILLKQRSIGDISRQNINETDRKKYRHTHKKNKYHNQNKIQIRSFFVDIQLIRDNLSVHVLLQDLALLAFEVGLIDKATLVEEEGYPDNQSVDDEEIGEDGRDVSVPNCREVRIQRDVVDAEQIADVFGG